jgi:GntR family transcriptional regulator, vanillate catabolism transcriptional regulator
MKSKRPLPLSASDSGTSQSSRATLALREMLLQGHFKPGERVREVPLAKHLGVSRIPLRLALERLAHEGFLESKSTRGFFAQEFAISDIYDTIDLRGMLEGMAARLAAERLSNIAELSTLRTLHDTMLTQVRNKKLTLDTMERYIDLNGRFHAELLQLSRSRRLQRTMEQLCHLPFASPNAFLRRNYLVPEGQELLLISIEHHRAIVEAIQAREAARAETLTREHARVSRRNLENALENQHPTDAMPGLKLVRL